MTERKHQIFSLPWQENARKIVEITKAKEFRTFELSTADRRTFLAASCKDGNFLFLCLRETLTAENYKGFKTVLQVSLPLEKGTPSNLVTEALPTTESIDETTLVAYTPLGRKICTNISFFCQKHVEPLDEKSLETMRQTPTVDSLPDFINFHRTVKRITQIILSVLQTGRQLTTEDVVNLKQALPDQEQYKIPSWFERITTPARVEI